MTLATRLKSAFHSRLRTSAVNREHRPHAAPLSHQPSIDGLSYSPTSTLVDWSTDIQPLPTPQSQPSQTTPRRSTGTVFRLFIVPVFPGYYF